MTDKWTDRLSEYLDGELMLDQQEALEAHLLECADCGRTLEDLRAVVTRATQVIDRPPATDLWAGIAERLNEEPHSLAQAEPKRRISFSVPQLAAASVALMLMSAGTMYVMTGRQQAQGVPAVAQQAPAAAGREPVTTDVAVQTPVKVKSPAAENYSVAIDEMQAALTTGSATLDTATMRVVETNLRAIDTAIAEARLALSRDPGNAYLNRYLDETMQRKIQLLRRATGILRAQT
jgi:anti-sigma factor RsiW